ncbi:MAG: hypothetical protein WBR26_12430 [Candidatus Acidiferrum sp.]
MNESSQALRFRLDGRWDVDIFKEMIVRVEADNLPVPNLSTPRSRNRAFSLPESGQMLIHNWNFALEVWWSNNFSKRVCYKTMAWTALAGSILYILALQIGVSEPVSFFIRFLVGFLGLVLCAVSLGCGTWMLGDLPLMQSQIVPYCNKLFASFLRWSRQLIRP